MTLSYALPRRLRRLPQAEAVLRILTAALQSADPARAVRRHLRRDGDQLRVDDRAFDLRQYRRVILIGAGKASLAMATAVAELLSDRLTGGAIIVKGDPPSPHLTACPQVALLPGDHPLPSARSVRSTTQVLSWVRNAGEDDLILFVLSGGGSALLTAPVAGVSLPDLQALTEMLLVSGARIDEINLLRRQLDRVKGGGLAALAAPATLITLILSDVVGSPLEAIASGPTVPDPTTAADALALLERYALRERVSPAVLACLERQTSAKPTPGYEHVINCLVGDNAQAAHAAVVQARKEGFHAALLTTFLQGEAREAGGFLGAVLRQMALSGDPLPRPACLVVGGETTVTLRGDGLGGRNQEVALAAAPLLDGLSAVLLVTLATDGEDGPTDAAGAAVDGSTLARARALGLSAETYLQRNDSYCFFTDLGDLIRTGPTGTNVNDLTFLFTFAV